MTQPTAPSSAQARALDLFQTLRRIEASHPELPRLGHAASVDQEPVRLGQDPVLAFDGASIVSWDVGSPPRIGVNQLGVFGPNGPLPLHVTEHAYQRAHQYQDSSFARFADVFHHRLISYFYRAWAETQPAVSHDRPEDDAFARRLAALIGERANEPDPTARAIGRMLLRAAGHMTGRTRHAEGLTKLLIASFEVPTRVEEFVGSFLPIPDALCWRIAGTGDRPSGVLGESSRIGTEVWDHQSKFRIVLGPLSREDHERFQPGQPALTQLIAIVQRYAGPELDWELRLQARGFTPTQLGLYGTLGRTAYLGEENTMAWQDLQFDPLAPAG